jgi:hypothetical protein
MTAGLRLPGRLRRIFGQAAARPISAGYVLGVAGWLVAAAVAIAVGVVAVRAIGSGIAGDTTRPLSDQQVRRALATATPVPTSSAAGTGGGPVTALSTAGGDLTVRCAGDQATLLSWTPAQGYRADDVERGPSDDDAGLKFESDRREIKVKLTCAHGVATAHTTTSTDD